MKSSFIQLHLFSVPIHGSLVSSSKAENQVKSGLLLDVVVGKGAAVLKLLASEDEALLIWGNALLVLDLLLDLLDGVRALNFKGNSLSGESLDEDLHSSSKAKNQMKGGLLLDVVVGKGATVLKLLASEDETLLIWGNALLVLDLLLDLLDGVRAFNLKGDGLSSESLDEDLHSSTKTENQVKSGLLLDVVFGKGAAIFKLLAS